MAENHILLLFVFTLNLHVVICGLITPPRPKDFTNNIRARKSWELIRNKPCVELVGLQNCSTIKQQKIFQMQFYMASNESSGLHVIKVRNSDAIARALKIQELDAVVVVDPLPEAHYGHTTIVFPIKRNINRPECKKLKGIFYHVAGVPECMYTPDYRMCTLYNKRVRGPKKICNFNHIPKVYDNSDLGEGLLQCLPNIEEYGPCPVIKVDKFNSCNNGPCTGKDKNRKGHCAMTCDYAVLLSGGWNKYQNKFRHYENLRDMYGYLHKKKSFKKENIKIFFANNSTVDLDNDKSTAETEPATESSRIINHIKNVCRRPFACIDTFVLYLNGPTLHNGNILLWDKHNDGVAEESEIIEVSKLIEPFKDCRASNVIIIVDQNFAGHIIDEVIAQRESGHERMNRVEVVAASTKNSYSWRRDFTKYFIGFDTDTSSSKKISVIFKNLKRKLSNNYKIKHLSGSNSKLTITGDYDKKPGCHIDMPGLDKVGWRHNKDSKRLKRSTKNLVKAFKTKVDSLLHSGT